MAVDPITAALDVGGKLIDRLWPDPAQAAQAKVQLLDMAQKGELAEVYQGCTGQLLEFTPCKFEVPTDALAYVTELYECVMENKLVMGSEFVIQDLVGDYIEDIARAKYKLTFLS